MKTRLYHLQLNVRDAAVSIPFYRDLLRYFEYRWILETPDALGATNGTTDLWVIAAAAEHARAGFHRKRPGLNHLAFGVADRDSVDRFHREYLDARRLPTLYGPPREYPEYRPGYYAVFFEDPDRVKLEVAYVPGMTP